jgi:hypothetical protein
MRLHDLDLNSHKTTGFAEYQTCCAQLPSCFATRFILDLQDAIALMLGFVEFYQSVVLPLRDFLNIAWLQTAFRTQTLTSIDVSHREDTTL